MVQPVLPPGLPVLRPGEVWLAGAGPGDPRHLTLWALAGLQQADSVVHDALVGAGVLALARPGAELLPAGKRGGQPSWRQEDITASLIALARQGKRVLRLKGGDPTVFGRGGEEAAALAAANIPFQLVPGVTAALAALSESGMPATMRGLNQAIVFATGHDAAGPDPNGLDWSALARLDQPVVFYMGLSQLPGIVERLLAAGMPPGREAAAIGAASLPHRRTVVATLGTLLDAVAAAPPARPVLLVVGRIVAARAAILGPGTEEA